MGNRVLVRHDGSTVRVPESDADQLLTLGYKEQAPSSELEAGIQAGTQDYYTTPGQMVKTGLEGGLSGLTLGLSDLLGDEDSRERARYNPGIRLGTELLGGLLPMVPGVGTVARFTPSGALIRGAEAAGTSVGRGSKVVESLTRGAVEGAGFGGGAALTTAQLNGDPITAEAIGAGIGWGALFGGGLGAIGGGVESHLESRAAGKIAREEAEIVGLGAAEHTDLERAIGTAKSHAAVAEGMKGEHAALGALEEGHYQNFAGSMKDAADVIKGINTTAVDNTKLDFSSINRSQQAIHSQLIANYDLMAVKAEARAFTKEFSAAKLAAKEGEFEKMNAHLDRFKENMALIETKLGGSKFFDSTKIIGQANDLIGLGKMRLDTAVKAAEDITQMEGLHSALVGFPKTAEQFVGMTPQRVEKLTAAVDQLGKLKAAEMSGIQESVKTSVDNMATGLGITIEGTPGQKMQGMWKLLKESRSKRAMTELKAAREGNLLWDKTSKAQDTYEVAKMQGVVEQARSKATGYSGLKRAAQYGVGKWAAGKVGGGAAGYGAYALGSSLVGAFVNLKGGVLGTIAKKAAEWSPKGARALQKYGSRIEPLATRLDGTEDGRKQDRKKLMEARAKEIHDAAPGIRDTLYRSVQPLSIAHPELAAVLHQQSVARYQFILGKLPKDPGQAYSALKSLWKPDSVQMEKFARYYEVFQDPVGVMTRALDSGKITLEAAEGLREMNPELFTHLRADMLMRISDPEIRSKLTYPDQVHLGVLIDLPLHATMDPRFISAQQQMYTERNKPLEMNPRVQPGGGAGRPSPGPSATSAQRITEH